MIGSFTDEEVHLRGILSATGRIRGAIRTAVPAIHGIISFVPPELPTYEGPYKVTPRAFDSVVLETRDKSMYDDVTVRPVPYYETTNESGGYTVYIAGTIEDE